MTLREERLIDIAQEILDYDHLNRALMTSDRQELQDALAQYQGDYLSQEAAEEILQPVWTPEQEHEREHGAVELCMCAKCRALDEAFATGSILGHD